MAAMTSGENQQYIQWNLSKAEIQFWKKYSKYLACFSIYQHVFCEVSSMF